MPLDPRPTITLGQTPEALALDIWHGMTSLEQHAFRRYIARLPKINVLGPVGYLELIVALSAIGYEARAKQVVRKVKVTK